MRSRALLVQQVDHEEHRALEHADTNQRLLAIDVILADLGGELAQWVLIMVCVRALGADA